MYKIEEKNKLKNKLIIMFVIFFGIMMLSSFKASLCALAPEEEYLGTKVPITVTLSGKPTESETVFKYEIKPASSNLQGAENEPTELTVVLNNESDKQSEGFLSKTEYIDFTDTIYTKPGVYKYTITEVSSSNLKEFPIATEQYKISIEVEEQEDGSLKHSFYKYAFDLNYNTKEDNLKFTHFQMTFVKVQLTTTGKMANTNEYFKITVSIFGKAGDVYNIMGQDNIVTYNNVQIKTLDKFEVRDGKYSFNIYLKDKQIAYIGSMTENGQVFYQIPVGTYVSIVENDARKYQTFINEEEGKTKRNIHLAEDEKNDIKIRNHADYDVAITGVYIYMLPYIILLIIAIVFVAFVIHKKIKDKKDNEDN